MCAATQLMICGLCPACGPPPPPDGRNNKRDAYGPNIGPTHKIGVEPGVNLSCPYWSSVTDQRGLEPQPLMGMQRRPSNITPLDYCRGQPSIGLKQTLPRVRLKVRLPTLKRVVCPSSP